MSRSEYARIKKRIFHQWPIRKKIQMLYFRLFKPWHYDYILQGEFALEGFRKGLFGEINQSNNAET